jgi:hypothetical protein
VNRWQELLARDEIRQLAERYAVAVDGKDLGTLAGLFAEDVDNGRYGPGRDGVYRFYDERLRLFHCSMHLVGNHVIDFDDDERASGVVYCRAHHHVAEPDHWFDVALAYFDTYVRQGDRWYFQRRRVRTWYRQDHPTGRVLAEPGEAGPTRGSRLPEAFPTFDAFWDHPA